MSVGGLFWDSVGRGSAKGQLVRRGVAKNCLVFLRAKTENVFGRTLPHNTLYIRKKPIIRENQNGTWGKKYHFFERPCIFDALRGSGSLEPATATASLFLGRQASVLAESELIVELPGQLAIGGTTIANFYNS